MTYEGGREEMTMERRTRQAMLIGSGVLVGLLASGAAVALANDADDDPNTQNRVAAEPSASPSLEGKTDPGPYIDYCPTKEQLDAHWDEYGFDYKPTVPCGEDGEALKGDFEEDEQMTNAERIDFERERLLTATRAPDEDGDPLTVEMILEDGTEAVLAIDGDPKVFEGMSLQELANYMYPSK